MNIWVIGRSYPMKSNNMVGSFELEQAKMLARHGHDVKYIAVVFHPFKRVNNWGFSSFEEDGVKIYTYSHPWTPERIHIHWKWYQKSKWQSLLKRVENKNGKPDIIHIHYPAMISEPDPVLDYKGNGTKIVATEHWTRVLIQKLNAYEKVRLKQYVTEVNAFLCVGEPLAESVRELTGTNQKINVVPNIVNPMFKPNYNRNERKGFTFIASGRIVPVKQFDLLIKAFNIAFANDDDVKLQIVGGGNSKQLQKEIDFLGFSDRVKLLGTRSREEVARLTAEADCLVCSSKLETFGVPVIEAGACGIPVVTTDAIGFLHEWKDFLGKVVHRNDLNELAEAMREVKENINQYDKKVISEYINQHFSEDVVYSMLLKIYTTC